MTRLPGGPAAGGGAGSLAGAAGDAARHAVDRQGATNRRATEPAAPTTSGAHAVLRSRRVAVTRAPEQGARLIELLRATGAEVVELPTVSFGPPTDPAALTDALARLETYDWVVLTSANGAAALGPRRDRPVPRIAVVGPATAAAVEALGWSKPWTPSRASGRALAEELPLRAGERVLLLRSDLADTALPSALAGRGGRVEDVVAYRTVPRREPFAEVPAVDACVVMSPSTIDGLVNGLGGDASRLGQAVLVAAGPTTAAHAAKRGLRAVEAAAPTPEGIVAALAGALNATEVPV